MSPKIGGFDAQVTENLLMIGELKQGDLKMKNNKKGSSCELPPDTTTSYEHNNSGIVDNQSHSTGYILTRKNTNNESLPGCRDFNRFVIHLTATMSMFVKAGNAKIGCSHE